MSQLSQHVLAAYYSDARLNILLCLNDIRQKLGMKPISDDAEIVSAFATLSFETTTPERQKQIEFQLRKRFRFLNVLTDPSPKDTKNKNKQDAAAPLPHDFVDHLKNLLTLINKLRNSTVHPSETDSPFENKHFKHLVILLGKIYDSSLPSIKQRFEHSTEVIAPFLRYAPAKKREKPSLKTVAHFSLAIEYFPKQEDNKYSQRLSDFAHVFFCSLFLDKSQSAALIHEFWQTEAGNDWYDEEKAIAKNLLTVYSAILPRQRLKSDETTTSTTIDSLSELSRCPREMLKVLAPEDKARFRHSDEIVSDENDGSADGASYLFTRGHQNRFIPFMMRYFDFDPDCKLRFAIDLGQFYYNVRFKPGDKFTDGVPRVRRLGQKIIHYARLDSIEKAVKPEEWQQLESNYLASSDDEAIVRADNPKDIQPLKPYIIPCYPHYHYFNDKIGFRLADNNNQADYPDLKAHNTDTPTCLDAPKGIDMQPEFWISPSQMQHLAFYNHLQKPLSNTPFLDLEHVLKRYRSGMIKLITALIGTQPELPGEAFSTEKNAAAQTWINAFFGLNTSKTQLPFNVSLSDLPKVVLHHLVGHGERKVEANAVIKRLNFMIEETQFKIDRIDKQLKIAKKRGKKGFKAIKCGVLGDFIADDLMRFQPIDSREDDGGKINSQQYQILQAALAFYGAHIDKPPKIVDLLRDAGLLQGDFAHPFIADLQLESKPNKYRGIISFYIDYLKHRKRYLQQYKSSFNASLMKKLPKWIGIRQKSSIDNWLAQFTDDNGKLVIDNGRLKQPLPLPKGFLYSPLFSMTATTIGITEQALYEEGKLSYIRNQKRVEVRPAISWLIRRLLSFQGDNVQAMYNYSRNYAVFDVYNHHKKGRGNFVEKEKLYYPESQRIKVLGAIKLEIEKIKDKEKTEKLQGLTRSFHLHEKRLRNAITEDILLFQSAKKYLNSLQLSENAPAPNWTLHGIQKTLLNTPIYYELPIPESRKLVYHPECKIRNLGEMRLLVQDRRLRTLMKFYPGTAALHHQELSAELNSYRRTRIKIMKKMHELEGKIAHHCGNIKWIPEEFKPYFGGRHGEYLYTLYAHYQDTLNDSRNFFNSPIKEFDPEYFSRARLIRNAFSHSEYPAANDFTHIVEKIAKEKVPENPANHRKIAEKLATELDELYVPWLHFFNFL